jgi:uncharacterized protein (DUF1501 family)
MKRNREQQQPSRRDFLFESACAAVGLTAMASTVWDLRLINAAAAQSIVTPGDYKALVCLFLFGGNDANNLIIPRGAEYAQYSSARGALAIPEASLLPVTPIVGDGRTYGLHPSCPELKALFDAGKLGLMFNTGTLVAPITRAQYLAKSKAVPMQLFSHNDQQVQWQTSVSDRPTRTGWGGRSADLLNVMNTNSSVSMSISLAGTNTWEVGNVVSQYNVGTGGPTGLNLPTNSVGTDQLNALKDLINLNHPNLYQKSYGSLMKQAIDNYNTLNTALGSGVTTWTKPFPATNLGDQLKMIAKIISVSNNLNHKRQIFFASVGGYDLHSAQLSSHASLLSNLSKCMDAFYSATVQLGIADKVTTFTASDFGRTFPVNGGAGSDHGWGNHQMMMGGAVKGQQFYGTFPTLSVNGPDDTGLGRWIPTTSVDEYSATMAKWFGVTNTDMATVFPNIGRFARPDLGFMNIT